MKQQLINLLMEATRVAGIDTHDITIQIQPTTHPDHGDFFSNIAMLLAKHVKMKPQYIAEMIVKNIPVKQYDMLAKVSVAGPGFINFSLKSDVYQDVVKIILEQGMDYGSQNIGKQQKLLIEFVSANPTGPLHVGHGRSAAYGDILAKLLRKIGFDITCEYYVNDAGRQMDILGLSVWLRYLQQCGRDISFPEHAYKGDYINCIATELYQQYERRFFTSEKLSQDENLDKLITQCKDILVADYQIIYQISLNTIIENIKTDLDHFGVRYDNWFSEQSLFSEDVPHCIQQLTENDWVYEKDGAKWFASSQLGDEKDRVLIRQNQELTYFASDIAYHLRKIKRGYQKMINIWGADHHGYINRIKAAMVAMGYHKDQLEIDLVQFVTLYNGKQKMQMSTRSGEFITLKHLQDEVGRDAARFFYIMRKQEQHLDFDMALAKSHSKDNPIYYIQYAHARICSVFDQLQAKSYIYRRENALDHTHKLTTGHEQRLLKKLYDYPALIVDSAIYHAPHKLAHYLIELANDFHSYYDNVTFLVDDSAIRNARLSLLEASKQVLHDSLDLLGINAPEKM